MVDWNYITQLDEVNHHLDALNQTLSQQNLVMHAQYELQRRVALEQQKQGLLQHVLHDTELLIESLRAVQQAEPFVAAVKAYIQQQLLGSHGIRHDLFQAIEHKRAMVQAYKDLAELQSVLNPKGRTVANKVGDAFLNWMRWQQLLTTEGELALRQLTSEIVQQQTAMNSQLRSAKVYFVIGLVDLVATLIVVSLLYRASVTQQDDFNVWGAGFLGFVSCIVLLYGFAHTARAKAKDLSTKIKKSEAHSARIAYNLAQYQNFLASEDGGLLLERANQQHPTLNLRIS